MLPLSKTRMTRQRIVILEELRKVDSHPTAEELYLMVRRRLPKISLGTVYRNLELLAASNEIARLDSAGSMRRFDGNPMPHRHIRCQRCGMMADVFGDHAPAPDISRVTVQGFRVSGVRVEYEGLCEACASLRG